LHLRILYNMNFTGLTNQEVEQSRQQYGSNVMTPPKKESVFKRFVQCFADPIIRILLVALILSIAISIYQFVAGEATGSVFLEPAGIFFAIILATLVGFILELKNEKTFQALNETNDNILVKVIRNGNVSQTKRRDIVVGDVVILDTGEEIPADCELLDAFNLTVNESTLTGELQCHKSVDPEEMINSSETTYPVNHIMKGCTIIEGYCTARVRAVGDATEAGKVFTAAQVQEGDATPLSKKLDGLADLITKISYGLALLIIVGRCITYFFFSDSDTDWLSVVKYLLDTLMIAVTLIVVAVPEGLPMSVNLSLAFSMKKLMKENTLPRTMHACETMGATTVICTDKTGTLTKNRMEVSEWQILEGSESHLNCCIALNSTANLDLSGKEPKTIGNPTEGALLLYLNKQGVNYLDIRQEYEMIDRLPFNTELKYMATVVSPKATALGQKPQRLLYIKGAPEYILNMCSLDDDKRAELQDSLEAMQNKAMRTLALAYKILDDNEVAFQDGRVKTSDISLLSIMGISDPVRDDVPGAMLRCQDAGIKVIIVTGDVVGTAREIGRQCGVITETDLEDAVMTGNEFAALSDAEILKRLPRLKILSRARPNDKQRLVKLLKQSGEVVAVTGDGTNDAPALNAADVGLSMGDGTAVAREASDMTILDNSFASIGNAVMWGRSLYKNIQRFIMFQMTINVVACLVVVVGAFLGAESPLTVTQMLWVNLIMDTFAALALASLPPSMRVMSEKPRRVDSSIISPEMSKRIFGIGGAFFVLLIGLLLWYGHTDDDLTPYELSAFFTTFVMLQFWNMFNARAFMSGRSAFFKLHKSRGFLLIAAIILIGQILIVTFGGEMFSVTPLGIRDWLIIIGATSSVLFIGEIVRLITRVVKPN